MANIDIGNSIEDKCCILLQENGFWAVRLGNTETGQPCDVVAIRNKSNWLIDVKHSKVDNFVLTRCEPNQKTTFKYATRYCGIKNTGFAIYFDTIKKFKWLPFKDIDFDRYKSINYKDMEDLECLIKKLE